LKCNAIDAPINPRLHGKRRDEEWKEEVELHIVDRSTAFQNQRWNLVVVLNNTGLTGAAR
jgi:hypothetical protein